MLLPRFVLLALVAATLLPGSARAQSHALDRGSVLASGSASATSTGYDDQDERHTSLHLSPSVQYFVAPGLALGGSVSLGYGASGGASQSFLGIGPAASYYFGAPDREVHPYLTGNVFLGRTRFGSDASEAESNHLAYRAAAGLMYLLAPGAGLHGELFYSATGAESELAEFGSDTFGLAMGLSLFVF